MINKKVFFASDIHLGHPSIREGRPREQKFVQWLDQIKDEAEELYLVGDVFDFWWEYKRVVPRGFVRVLGKLADFTDAGIPVHIFTGNHDVWMFNYLPEEIGVIMHHHPFLTEIKGKKFYIAHGDGLGPGDLGYKLLKSIFTNKPLQWLYSRLHPNFAFWLAQSWSNSSRDAKGIEAEQFNGEENELLYKHAKQILQKQYFDYFVFGHRHVLIEKEITNDSKFILLGDWLYNFSYGVFDGDKLKLCKIDF